MSETPDANQAGEAESFDPPASASTSEEFRYGLNVDLADKLIDWVKRSQIGALYSKEPTWDQEMWFHVPRSLDGERKLDCGTACCVAGYIADDAEVLSKTIHEDFGAMPALLYHKVNHLDISWEDWCAHEEEDASYFEDHWNMYGVPWELMGSFFLGIPMSDARVLFASNNTVDMIESLLDSYKSLFPA